MLNPAKRLVILICAILILAGCGPSTIFVRPGIDTPSHHVSNGNKLLQMGKVNAAFQEFSRAKELDPEYALAYVGLALVYGHRGEFQLGRQHLNTADNLAISADETEAVNTCHQTLNDLEKKATD